MFKLHWHNKYEKSGEKFDFNFSGFNVIQIPKGWDKLVIYIVSMRSGKSIAKLSKATVQNRSCEWTESLAESLWIAQDDSSKELEEALYKFVVSMGSSRSGILGEAVVNLTEYTSLGVPVPVSLPLKKCNAGTILKFKIQCLSQRTRDKEKCKETSQLEDLGVESDDTDNRSDVSENVLNRNSRSSSGNQLGGGSHPEEPGSREMSLSLSGSHCSSDSGEVSAFLGATSPRNSMNIGDAYNPIRRQDSAGSQNSMNAGNCRRDDPVRSNPSSFGSRALGSGNHLPNQLQELNAQSPSHRLGQLSLKQTNSSKDLVEAAEETIEELHSEAKMWERNARKLKIDLDTLRKGFSDQSKRLEDMEMELVAANNERDGFKLELDQLKLSLDESIVKQSPDTAKLPDEDFSFIREELENEIKFLKESNATLSLQLLKTQESNIEFVSIVQELEETVEKQRLEIQKLSAQREENDKPVEDLQEQMWIRDKLNLEKQVAELEESQRKMQVVVQSLEKSLEEKNQEIELEKHMKEKSLLDFQEEWECKLSAKGETLKQESGISNLQNISSVNGGDPDIINEIVVLRAKVLELEKDCSELTDENLELILQMKESERIPRDVQRGRNSLDLDEFQNPISSSGSGIDQLKFCIHQLEQQMKDRELLNGVTSNDLQIQIIDLKKIVADLEIELQSKDKAGNLGNELCKSQLEVKTEDVKITELQKQIESYRLRQTEWENQPPVSSTNPENLQSCILVETSENFSEMHKQLQLALATLKNSWSNIESHEHRECEDGPEFFHSCSNGGINQKEQAAMLNDLLELNNLLRAKILERKVFEERISEKDVQVVHVQKQLNDHILKENSLLLSVQDLENLKARLQSEITDMGKDLEANQAITAELEAVILMKDEEIKVLSLSRVELEEKVSNLLKEKIQLEGNLEIAKTESSFAAKRLDDVQQDFMVLTNSMDAQVSANKILERKLNELEISKHELEILVSETEEENVQLSERLSGLEAQLRHLTDERESMRLDLEKCRRFIMDLKNEIEKLGIEKEMQKTDLKQKLEETQMKCSEAEEESEILKRSLLKLEATVESLIEECSSLQKRNEELQRQRLKSYEHCTHLEAELSDSRNNFSECCQKIEILEQKYFSLQKDVVSKENLFTLELETLLQEHKQNEEKLILAESLLKQNDLEKATEVEKLQREVAHLTAQIAATQDERERMASQAVLEVSTLRADKNKLENSLEECYAKARQYENELYALRSESEGKLQDLTNLLSVSKQNEVLFISEHDHMKRSLKNAKSSEEKLKSTLGETEMKLKALEYERELSINEIANLKDQLQDMVCLQGEISSLKSLLNETKYEKGKLESSLQVLSADYEELRTERFTFVEKILYMQKALSDGEECMHNKVALEEKLLRLECDLNAKEASCANDAELKNELSRIKRTNSQLQRKTCCLEEERDNYLTRVQALEKELKLKRENKHVEIEPDASESRNQEASESTVLKLFEGKNSFHEHKDRQQEADLLSKIQLLETELSEALEANEKYKMQISSYAATDSNDCTSNFNKSAEECEAMDKKVSILEAELKDMRDRYFDMSLKFAEVEAEREGLVMKLRSYVKPERRWFS